MGLTHRLFAFIGGFILVAVLVIFNFVSSWQAVNLALARVEHAQKIGANVDHLERNLIIANLDYAASNQSDWIDYQQKLTTLLLSAPELTPSMQTLYNSINRQNQSMKILYQHLTNLTGSAKNLNTQTHLTNRLLIQVESIREDCLHLSALVEANIKDTVRAQFYAMLTILLVGFVGVIWGTILVNRLLNRSISEINTGIEKIQSGHYPKIKLTQDSQEFNSFVEKFNNMSEQLKLTTVSRDKLQQIVDERTQELLALSNTDQLTNVANRRALFERGGVEFSRIQRHSGSLSLLLIDCDYFKKINDTYGHLVGDNVLKHLCKVCSKQLRDIDFIGRYGGEEFVVILPSCDAQGAEHNVKRIQQALASSPLIHDSKSIYVSVSIGVVTLKASHQSFEQMISDADQAMYLAKEKGRNRYEIAG